MSTHPFTIPVGLSHEPSLSRLTPDDRRKHHLQAIRQIRFNGSPADVRAYQERHPETAGYRARSIVMVSAPKPPGYNDAVARMVGGWLTSDEARRKSNTADVNALNAALGGGERFNPANYLNRPLGPALRKRIAGQFEQRGCYLPADANTLAKVKKAAKAAASGDCSDATAFGSIGTLTDGILTIGGKAFRIVEQRGKEHVRFYRDGSDARLRLDLLTEFLSQSGLLDAGRGNPSLLLFTRDGENGSDAAIAQVRPGETGSDVSTKPQPNPCAPSRPVESGSDCFAVDPLELTLEELANWRLASQPHSSD
jgi:hypothetical protein